MTSNASRQQASKAGFSTGSGEGALVVFAPGDELKVLARNNFKEQIFATPAVSPDGILYVRTPSALYAVGER